MAERKKPQTESVVTADERLAEEQENYARRNVKELSETQFNSLIRFIKRSHIDRVDNVRVAAKEALGRLEVSSDKRDRVAGIPFGSDQYDAGTFVTWAKSVQPEETPAIAQLKQIAATCDIRWE